MRNRYFVCYDVSDPQRLAQIYKKMKGYGEAVQYSVFVCELNSKEIIFMKEDLSKMANLNEDRILIIDTGSVTKRNEERITTMGMPLYIKNDSSIVI